MAGKLHVPRSRGALTGMLLILLGAWGGLIALIGPYFHYAYTPDTTWTYATGRLWLEILPGIGAVTGGVMLLASSLRPIAILGAWLAAISGAWFAIGGALAPLWTQGGPPVQGTPVGGAVARAVEQIGFFSGLGVALAFVAALAIGRLTVLAATDVTVPASGKSVSPASRPSPSTGNLKAGRTPAGPTLLRRVVSGKGAARPSPADSQRSNEPADINS